MPENLLFVRENGTIKDYPSTFPGIFPDSHIIQKESSPLLLSKKSTKKKSPKKSKRKSPKKPKKKSSKKSLKNSPKKSKASA